VKKTENNGRCVRSFVQLNPFSSGGRFDPIHCGIPACFTLFAPLSPFVRIFVWLKALNLTLVKAMEL